MILRYPGPAARPSGEAFSKGMAPTAQDALL